MIELITVFVAAFAAIIAGFGIILGALTLVVWLAEEHPAWLFFGGVAFFAVIIAAAKTLTL